MQSQSTLDPSLELILSAVQLSVYILILALAAFKLAKANSNSRLFLRKFYGCVTCIALIQIGIQSYMLAEQAGGSQPQITICMVINLYAITFQAITIFLLSDYWNETREIITKSSTEQQLADVNHYPRYAVFALWAAGYSAFVIYSLAEGKLDSAMYREILALGVQGLGAAIMLWAIVIQVMRGHSFSIALQRYEQMLKHVSMRKIQFRLLYWMTSFFNLIRVLFLITVTVIVDLYAPHTEWQWLGAYIYTFSNCAVLLVYIFGFSTEQVGAEFKVETLLQSEGKERRESKASSSSKHQTELSSSLSHKTQ